MESTIPYELIQSFEIEFGKKKTGEFIKFYEKVVETFEEKANGLALQKKFELKDDLTKELATKADFLLVKAEMQLVKADLKLVQTDLENRIDKTRIDLENRIDKTRIDLENRIDKTRIDLENRIDKVDMKLTMRLNLLIILTLIALTFMNPVVAKLLSNWLKLGL
jgi:hypothetical protein